MQTVAKPGIFNWGCSPGAGAEVPSGFKGLTPGKGSWEDESTQKLKQFADIVYIF